MSVTVNAKGRMGRRYLWLLVLPLGASRCESDAAAGTWRTVREVYSLSAESRQASRGWSDGWGRAFRYEMRDTTFSLVSAGTDGIMGSPDDLDFSPTRLAARAGFLAGCWTVPGLQYPDGELRELMLTTEPIDKA